MVLHELSLFLSSSSVANYNLTAVVPQSIMFSLPSLLVASSLAIQAVLGYPDPSQLREREAELLKRSVDSFIATEGPIALRNVLCNIGSSGACVSGASSGLVIAGPGKANPDCIILPLKHNLNSNVIQISILGPEIPH